MERARASALVHRRHGVGHGLEKARSFRDQHRHGLEGAQPLDEPGRLDERVVGDRRHRPVPATALDVQDERRAPLLGRGAEVQHSPAELDAIAGAFVHGVVAAHRIRVLRAQPLEAVRDALAHLLVGGGGEDQVAGGLGTPPARATRSRRRSRPPGPSCRARRVPRRSRPAARPTTGRPTIRPDRRERCPCARAATGSARRRDHGSAPPGSPARARGRRARTRHRTARGTRAGARPPRSRSRAG